MSWPWSKKKKKDPEAVPVAATPPIPIVPKAEPLRAESWPEVQYQIPPEQYYYGTYHQRQRYPPPHQELRVREDPDGIFWDFCLVLFFCMFIFLLLFSLYYYYYY